MDLGRNIIAAVLSDKSALKKFIEAGFDLGWMNDKQDLSRAAIFSDSDLDAYRFILKFWERNRQVPSLPYFEHSFPPAAFRLPKVQMSVTELLEMAEEDRTRVQLEVAGSEFIDLHDAGDFDAALEVMAEAARKIRKSRTDNALYITWDGSEYDVEVKLSRKERPGIRVGIAEMDKTFAGFQPGQLVTFLGRAKAAKTSHLIKSALAAHDDGWAVMLTSVEISGDSIADRADCFAAGVEYERYVRGRLTGDEKKKIRASRSNRGNDEYFAIVQPMGRYTVTDLEADVDRFAPHVVYIDGFYFLTDHETGKPGSNWEGHDNLARQLKELAMRRGIVIVVTMQIREKQARGAARSGFDDNTMMGGTALIMWSDMVLTFDMDQESFVNTVACSRSRTRYLPTVRGQWRWKYSQFEVLPDEDWFDPDEED